MNLLRNSVQLIGHLGKDPEMTKLDKGKRIARVSLATNENYGGKSKDAQTQWHNLVAWDGKAEFMSQYLKKGQEIAIQGRLTHRSYEAKDGSTKYITEIIVNEVLPFGRKDM
ncbi:MAG TPA: single-stranded DNA-binding protein [Saprospiraceae bacterium]|nr:single-stranded DNA-binding protein [Saprospiraceae bacterium]HUN16176.1 single-stranded DNA-binding protein [Saprospiraceae bacterium]